MEHWFRRIELTCEMSRKLTVIWTVYWANNLKYRFNSYLVHEIEHTYLLNFLLFEERIRTDLHFVATSPDINLTFIKSPPHHSNSGRIRIIQPPGCSSWCYKFIWI